MSQPARPDRNQEVDVDRLRSEAVEARGKGPGLVMASESGKISTLCCMEQRIRTLIHLNSSLSKVWTLIFQKCLLCHCPKMVNCCTQKSPQANPQNLKWTASPVLWKSVRAPQERSQVEPKSPEALLGLEDRRETMARKEGTLCLVNRDQVIKQQKTSMNVH